ncbi:hypothetical protein SORBI_3003G183532 [Sorghum bicolor]|uniref:Uncharacterized protein n=1 Tax=Sorghum bicolor TaxID=4558 RepID=A0A1W0VXY6_SORBI|nr:hypothetical protein SORBI_3003G183532 [Sorghum bicolor]
MIWLVLVCKLTLINLTDCKHSFIWTSQNNGSFKDRSMYMYMVQEGVVICRATYWICQWSLLFTESARASLKDGCRLLEYRGWNLFYCLKEKL